MKTILKQAIKEEQDFIATNDSKTNPQIVAMVSEARGRLDAFEACLDWQYGNRAMLKTFIRGD